jgi:hypothetical protein
MTFRGIELLFSIFLIGTSACQNDEGNDRKLKSHIDIERSGSVELFSRRGDDNFVEMFGYDFSQNANFEKFQNWSYYRGIKIRKMNYTWVSPMGLSIDDCDDPCSLYEIYYKYIEKDHLVVKFIVYVNSHERVVAVENYFDRASPTW